MILGRTRNELATVGSYLLAHSDVEQSSAESFYLRGSMAVMTLVAALRCLCDSSDRVAAADLLHHLHALGILRSPHDEDFLAAGSVDLQALLATEGIAFNTAHLLSMSLYDCCEELVRSFRLDPLDVAYVASLLNKAAAFSGCVDGGDLGTYNAGSPKMVGVNAENYFDYIGTHSAAAVNVTKDNITYGTAN
jgi:hypothetical protein